MESKKYSIVVITQFLPQIKKTSDPYFLFFCQLLWVKKLTSLPSEQSTLCSTTVNQLPSLPVIVSLYSSLLSVQSFQHSKEHLHSLKM